MRSRVFLAKKLADLISEFLDDLRSKPSQSESQQGDKAGWVEGDKVSMGAPSQTELFSSWLKGIGMGV